MQSTNYDWADFYMEFADKLTGYNNNRPELIRNIVKIYDNAGLSIPKLYSIMPPPDIDPFTVFALFAWRGIVFFQTVMFLFWSIYLGFGPCYNFLMATKYIQDKWEMYGMHTTSGFSKWWGTIVRLLCKRKQLPDHNNHPIPAIINISTTNRLTDQEKRSLIDTALLYYPCAAIEINTVDFANSAPYFHYALCLPDRPYSDFMFRLRTMLGEVGGKTSVQH